MGAKGASEIIFKKEIQESDNPQEKLLEKEKEYAELFANPYKAAERGFIDEVIEPKYTRAKLIKSLCNVGKQSYKKPKKETWKHSHCDYFTNETILFKS